MFDNCIGRCHKGGCIRLNLLHLNEKYVAKLHTIGHCTTLVSVPLVILTRNCDYCTGALVCLGRFTPLIMSGTVSKLKLPVADGLNANWEVWRLSEANSDEKTIGWNSFCLVLWLKIFSRQNSANTEAVDEPKLGIIKELADWVENNSQSLSAFFLWATLYYFLIDKLLLVKSG